MIELPEVYVLAEQIEQTILGKTICSVVANAHPHGFATYSGDPASYSELLCGKKITSSRADLGTYDIWDSNVEIVCEDRLLAISTPIKYHKPGEKLPLEHQLLIGFDDDSYISCTVQMWGSMLCTPYEKDHLPIRRHQKPNPFMDDFDKAYFSSLMDGLKPSMSVKAFLATEKRIPGLGNGVLQDILFNAGIHPKRKLQTLTSDDREKLYQSVKSTLLSMRIKGGRDTERDLFGCKGGYKTILSANTLKYPCPVCCSELVRESFLGGNVYYCPTCQPKTV